MVIINYYFNNNNYSFKYFDRGLFEQFGPFGLGNLFDNYSKRATSLQTGFIYHYAFAMIFGLILFLTFYLFIDFYDYSLFFLVLVFLPILNLKLNK